ncbi:MAG: class I SAM-dependent methyltransferase [Chloroflexota bacterium]
MTAGLGAGYRALEVGCGTGSLLPVLQGACPGGLVLGMDLFADGLLYARRRGGAPLVQADLHRPPFAAPFALVGLFDVLEHVADDLDVLRALAPLVAAGGALLLTVPAKQSLWSYFDDASCHCRRYEVDELAGKLRAAGFAVEFASYFVASTYPLLWLRRKIAGRTNRHAAEPDDERTRALALGELRVVPVANEVLSTALALETRLLLRRRALPFGSSLVALARRPDVALPPLTGLARG